MKFHILFNIVIAYCFHSIGAFELENVSLSYRIKNFAIQNCTEDSVQLLSLENVTIETLNTGDLGVSGTVTSTVNLVSPIKVSVNMKRYFLGFWLKVFCINHLGSCTYPDLCQYGVDTNDPCPEHLARHNVPCRCPIPKGNYSLPQGFIIPNELFENSILSGKYSGQVTVTTEDTELGCYDVQFTVY